MPHHESGDVMFKVECLKLNELMKDNILLHSLQSK